jgi:hypothetical protein
MIGSPQQKEVQYGIIILQEGRTELQASNDLTLPLDEGMYVFFGD